MRVSPITSYTTPKIRFGQNEVSPTQALEKTLTDMETAVSRGNVRKGQKTYILDIGQGEDKLLAFCIYIDDYGSYGQERNIMVRSRDMTIDIKIPFDAPRVTGDSSLGVDNPALIQRFKSLLARLEETYGPTAETHVQEHTDVLL